MSDITPADLAKFVHRVPVGAIIPAGTEYVIKRGGSFCLVTLAYDYVADNPFTSRWTADPIPAPVPTLAERVRSLTRGRVWSPSDLDQLTLIVAELAEKVEGVR